MRSDIRCSMGWCTAVYDLCCSVLSLLIACIYILSAFCPFLDSIVVQFDQIKYNLIEGNSLARVIQEQTPDTIHPFIRPLSTFTITQGHGGTHWVNTLNTLTGRWSVTLLSQCLYNQLFFRQKERVFLQTGKIDVLCQSVVQLSGHSQ